jgi:hypothetical protein
MFRGKPKFGSLGSDDGGTFSVTLSQSQGHRVGTCDAWRGLLVERFFIYHAVSDMSQLRGAACLDGG